MKTIPVNKFSVIMGPRLTAVVSSGTVDEPNAMLASWVSPVSFLPPLLMVAVKESRYTYELIGKYKEFCVSFFGREFLDRAFYLGTHSGRNENKIEKLGLRILKGEKINTPLLKDCVSHIECKLHSKLKTGDHFLFIGKVVNILVDEKKADSVGVKPSEYLYWRMSRSKEDTYNFN